MKTILVAFNARYSHSSLALRYIKTYNKEKEIEIAEYTINDQISHAYWDLLKRNGDIYCFSLYIWNKDITLKIAEMLKKAKPNVKIVLGGPECSYSPDEIFNKAYFIDYILRGEGEVITGKLIDAIEKGKTPHINGIAVKNQKSVMADCVDLSTIPFPYTNFTGLENKIVYFETSRGCPFRCSYCLSSVEKGIRYFPMEYVKNGLDQFFSNNIPLVKLIDRTFNSNEKRAIEIIEYIIKNSKVTKVHFEIDPGILTDKIMDALSKAPKNLFQLEMGIQSTNPITLNEVNRSNNINKISKNIERLKELNNLHIHLDLIAGLPYENYKSFENSFNYVYSLKPDMLQLGFLKVLHGTPIEKNDNIIHTDFPPYEVISTKWLTPQEVCKLKLIDKAVDIISNSGAFKRTLNKLINNNAFKIFEKVSIIFDTNKEINRYDIYGELYKIFGDEIYDELCLDFIENSPNRPMPEFSHIIYPKIFKKNCISAIGDKFKNNNLRFEPLGNKIYMMDYTRKILTDITKEYDSSL